MPTPKKPDRKRLEIIAEPEWINLLAKAAQSADRSVSSYARTAINAAMRADGFVYEPQPAPAPEKKPRRGRGNK